MIFLAKTWKLVSRECPLSNKMAYFAGFWIGNLSQYQHCEMAWFCLVNLTPATGIDGSDVGKFSVRICD
jgi:hypothetical protein